MSFARILARLVRCVAERDRPRDRPLCVDCWQPIEAGRTGWTCGACEELDRIARTDSGVRA